MNDKTVADSSVNDSPTIADSSGRGTLPDSSIDDNITFADYKAGGSEWETGDVIMDTYEVTGVLGKGGMGKVFKVHHRSWNADLAVKSALPELIQSQKGIADFIREAETWTNLGLHPHIVYCYYVRTIDGIPRVFAEYVKGGSLSDCIANRTLYESNSALAGILDIAIQTAWGLQYAHEQGLIHQDVKPANILMTESGMAKITDFGIASARSMAGSASGDQTVDGTWGGMTPGYCSPEQAEIAHQASTGIPKDERLRLTHRTDIWSWAATVLEMFLGERTWPVGQVAGFALENYDELKQALSSEIPAMPDAVRALLARCFQMDEADRPETMSVAADELARIYESCLGAAYPRQMPKATKLRAAALNNRAVSLYDIGKKDEAEKVWEEALRNEPHDPESTYNLGLAQWRTGRLTDDMLVHKLDNICNINPSDWIAQYLLSQVYMERYDFESAAGILEKLLAQYADNAEIGSALKQAQENTGQSMKCLRTLGDAGGSTCMSADGKLALSNRSWGDTFELWDIATGKSLRTFEGHKSTVKSICISSDCRYALSSGSEYDPTLKLWDIATGACLRTFEGHTEYVRSVCMSADGRHALSGSHDRTIKLWDIATGECLRTFEAGFIVASVCMSPDGRYVLSGEDYNPYADLKNRDKMLKLWDIETGECLRIFRGHSGSVTSVCISADGRYALSGSCDNMLKLWDIATGECLRTFKGHTRDINSVCISADGKLALSGGDGVRLWDAATGKCLRTFTGHTYDVSAVCMSADGRHALSGGGELKLWDISGISEIPAPLMLSKLPDTNVILSERTAYENQLRKASRKGKAGDFSGKYEDLQKIRPESGQSVPLDFLNEWAGLYTFLPKKGLSGIYPVKEFKGNPIVLTACMSADGRYAISTGRSDKTIRLWDLSTGERLRTFTGHSDYVNSVCMSADGRYALSGCNELKLWDVSTGTCLRTFEGHEIPATAVCMSPDGRYALSCSREIKLWDIAAGKCLRTLKGHMNRVLSICMSADGRYALSGGDDKKLILWDIATGKRLRTFGEHDNSVRSVCMSADSRYALSAANNRGSRYGPWDRTPKLWDIAAGECLCTFEGHGSEVISVCMSADGRYALSGSTDHTVKVWEVKTGRCLHTLEEHTDIVNAICLNADGRYLLSVSEDNTMKVWQLDWELEKKEPADWDEGAKPYLINFIILHTPYDKTVPNRKGTPFWTEDDFQKLLYGLGCAGYGWLRPEGVRARLNDMAARMKDDVLK